MCLHCSQKAHETTVVQLQSEVDILRAEVAELRAALDITHANPVSVTTHMAPDSQISASWTTVTGCRKGRKNKNKPTCNDPNSVTDSCGSSTAHSKKNVNQPGANSTSKSNCTHSSKAKVAGARRIWDTLQECTVKSVRNVLTHLCNIDNSVVQVKRKARVHPLTNKNQWWFVLHAHENVLVTLEQKWASVKLQTSWKLEPCFKPIDTSVKTVGGSSNSPAATSVTHLTTTTNVPVANLSGDVSNTSDNSDNGNVSKCK